MRFALFYHSLLSDWNHGNAHFLRGIVTELLRRGHGVTVYEPHDSWSLQNLRAEHGDGPIAQFRAAYPGLESVVYDRGTLDLEEVAAHAEVILVHEWNDPHLVNGFGQLRAGRDSFRLLFHDTHHRLVTDADRMNCYRLEAYDGVLAYGRILRDLYLQSGRARRAWVWHEAADIRVFKPKGQAEPDACISPGKGEAAACAAPQDALSGDLVWIGNWGDDERSEELQEFLIDPVRALGLRACVYGVRYPDSARQALAAAGITYAGWLPNFQVPEVFGRFKLTLHVPRRPYVKALPGIPTIRVFEALACGIPLVCSHWDDAENLFHPGLDYLVARTGKEMKRSLRQLLENPERARALAGHGRRTIESRHTCGHRVNELREILAQLGAPL